MTRAAAAFAILALAGAAAGHRAVAQPLPIALALVLPVDLRAGDTVSVSVIDARMIADIPVLRGIKLPPLPAASQPPTLVLPGGVERPATQPAKLAIDRNAKDVRIDIETGDGARKPGPVVPVQPADIEKIPPGASAPPRPFRTQPIWMPGMQMITGPFDGDFETTTVEVGERVLPVVAETPRALWFALPDDVAAGEHTVHVHEGAGGAALPISVLKLEMSADRLHLMRGQSTNFRAVVSGPEKLPSRAWRVGDPPDTVPLDELRRLAPSFKLPPAGGPGVIFFAIENGTRDIVTISPANNETSIHLLDEKSFAAGPFAYSGVARSKQTGTFAIHGLVVAFLEQIEGTPLPADHAPRTTGTKSPPPAAAKGPGTTTKGPPEKDKKTRGPKIVITAAGEQPDTDPDPCPCYAQIMWGRLSTLVDIGSWFVNAKRDGYHATLIVQIKEERECPKYVIELTSMVEPGSDEARRVGQVKAHTDGIDYGIRVWRNGRINQGSIGSSGGGAPVPGDKFPIDCALAKQMLKLAKDAPDRDWFSDNERGTWTSNSFISWLLTKSGLDAESVRPPPGGDHHGWKTGIREAGSR